MSTYDQFIQKGNEAIRKNDVVAAKESFQKALSLKPNSSDAMVELARIEFVMRNRAEAEHLLNNALDIQPKHPLGHATRGALRILDKQFHEAIQCLEKAIKLNPKLGMAYLNLGIAQREIGLMEQSESNIRKAIDINAEDFEAYYALGHTLCHTGRIEDGILAVLQCIKINPLFEKGYRALGTLYAMGARPDLAEQIYDECLKRLPNAIMIRERLIDLYLQYGKPEAAHAEMEVIAQQRGSVTDWLRFGTISTLIKNFKAAESGFQQAAKVASEAWEPHYNLGELYDALGKSELAGNEYEIAVKLNSGNYKPHNGLGLWLMKEDRWKEAVEQLKKAHQLAPLAAEPAYNLALALAQTEQKNDAKALLNQIDFKTASDSLQKDAARLMNVL